MAFLPGSPFNDEKLSADQINMIKDKYGLNDPMPVQFVRYVKNMLTGDFGLSYYIAKDTPITTLLSTRIPVTFRIGGQSVLVGAFIGLFLGIIAALKHNTIWDTLTTVISVLGVSIPSYVFALGLSYLMGFKLKLFPMLYKDELPFLSSVLPTIALCLFTMASIARFTRTELIEVLNSDYMLFVESKGIGGSRMIVKHALRNALIPVITILGPTIVNLMTGSMVIEKIFSIPGVGQLLVSGIQSNDYNVISAMSFIFSLLYVLIMLVVDLLYGVIDPRIRLAKEGE
jgi:oligopeptide transport system permease protein